MKILSRRFLEGLGLCLLSRVAAKNAIVGRHCGGAIRHVHIAVGRKSSSSMSVSFSSLPSNFQPESPPIGAVLVGTRPDELNRIFVEEEGPLFYNASLPRVKENVYHSPFQHHVTVSNLDPDTKYFYRCITRGQISEMHELQRLSSAGLAAKPVAENFAVEAAHHWGDDSTVDSSSWADEDEYEESGDGDGNTNEYLRRRRHLESPHGPYDPARGSCPNPSAIRSFYTAPAPGENRPKKNIKFAVVADLGQFEHSIETISHLQKHRFEYDAVMIAGDIAYTSLDPRRWDTFFDLLDDFHFWDEIPTMIAAGNHDIDKTKWASSIFDPYESRFRMPHVHGPRLGTYQDTDSDFGMENVPYPLEYEYGNSYYDFIYGPSHHIVINSYAAMEPESSQYKWLARTLAKVDRSVTPWLFVTFHVPIYNTYRDHYGDVQRLVAQEHIEPLLVKYKVNIIFNGHVHAYSRTKNVAFEKPTPTGPIHILMGNGGRDLKAKFQNEEPEAWVAKRDGTVYGYGTIEILNRTHAQWDLVHAGQGELNFNEVWKKRGLMLPPDPSDSTMIANQFYCDEISS